MTDNTFLEQLLAPYRPELPISQLVVEVNRMYHRFEARDYDARHPEVYRQLPALWDTMIATAKRELDTTWRVLDFGCGTGFEAEQLLRVLPAERLEHLTCYDPSPEMLARCREKIAPCCEQAAFLSDARHLRQRSYNVLLTNSLLHHLPAPLALAGGILSLLEPGAVWLAGHEPSRRFYMNPACLRAYAAFTQERRWRKFVQPGRYVARGRAWLGLASNPTWQTAREVYRRGLFGRQPPGHVIGLLVDVHVAHSDSEAAAGRGFDMFQWQQQLRRVWQCIWRTSYGFMGPWYEGNLSPRWQQTCHDLARRYPDDGANFCTVWRRSSCDH
jgi:SAM-dependent methyltransferase